MLDMATDLADHVEGWLDLWQQADRTFDALPADVQAEITERGVPLDQAAGLLATVTPEDRVATIAMLGALLDLLRRGRVRLSPRARRCVRWPRWR